MSRVDTAASQVLIATDLDRTMIYSQAAIGGDPSGSDLDSAPSPLCVEYYNGGPLSHMSVESIELLIALSSRVPVIPTTTRTIAQFQRIDLPGGPWKVRDHEQRRKHPGGRRSRSRLAKRDRPVDP